MKEKKLVLIALLLLFFCVKCDNPLNYKKDNWLKEASAKRYSEKREKEVWGGVLRGNDAGLFYGTPLYDLADEMSGFSFLRNHWKIKRLISELPNEYINYQEEKFRNTIGHFAITVGDFKALRLLLDRGLNPNLMNMYGNANIIDINSSYRSRLPEGLETLKYMIKKGGNVNLYSPKAQLHTPLIEAANSNFENVKVLIEAGADPNFIVKDSEGPFKSALSTALVNRRMEIINYLIFDQKVDFRTLKHPLTSKFHPGKYEILYRLRDLRFDLNTKDYEEKMKLVAYLKTQGLDYWKTPIPENISSNTDFTKEYLNKY